MRTRFGIAKFCWQKLPSRSRNWILGRFGGTINKLFESLAKYAKHDELYDLHYYLQFVDPAASRSAGVMAQSIVSWFHPSSFVDVGCGSGALLFALSTFGVRCEGLEYAQAGLEICKARGLAVRKFDLETNVLVDSKRFDLVISLEVGEHLPASMASAYVHLLCELGEVIVYSAARPGQIGLDHINCQPLGYWANIFEIDHFFRDQAASDYLSEIWRLGGVEAFYHENLQVFRRDGQPNHPRE